MTDIAYNLSNAEIADRLASLAQLLSAQKENPYRIKAYQRAAAKIRALSESIQELVHEEIDLTTYAGIGEAISGAIQEIVRTGTLVKLENDFLKRRCGISRRITRQPSSVARLFVRRNPPSSRERESRECAVPDDGFEPGRLLPLARPARGHTGENGAMRRATRSRTAVAIMPRIGRDHERLAPQTEQIVLTHA
jgi:hypothetical protein